VAAGAGLAVGADFAAGAAVLRIVLDAQADLSTTGLIGGACARTVAALRPAATKLGLLIALFAGAAVEAAPATIRRPLGDAIPAATQFARCAGVAQLTADASAVEALIGELSARDPTSAAVEDIALRIDAHTERAGAATSHRRIEAALLRRAARPALAGAGIARRLRRAVK